jgi:hypothetical protein
MLNFVLYNLILHQKIKIKLKNLIKNKNTLYI